MIFNLLLRLSSLITMHSGSFNSSNIVYLSSDFFSSFLNNILVVWPLFGLFLNSMLHTLGSPLKGMGHPMSFLLSPHQKMQPTAQSEPSPPALASASSPAIPPDFADASSTTRGPQTWSPLPQGHHLSFRLPSQWSWYPRKVAQKSGPSTFSGAVVPIVGVRVWGGRRLAYPYALCALIRRVDGDSEVVDVDL